MKNLDLWTRLNAFKLDDETSAFPFSMRLARDNNWSHDFALKACEEYKKFIYLSTISNHPVTPSDEVDQAWHLHLLYTQSYWEELCQKTLGKPLHHGPTKGGEKQKTFFKDCYEQTKSLYTEEFGHIPPKDLWPDSKTRFGTAPHFKRINFKNHWVIPKSITIKASAAIASLTITSACSIKYEDDPFAAIILFTSMGYFIYWIIIKLLRTLGILKPRKHKNKNNSGCAAGCGGCFFGSGGGDSGCSSGCGGCGGCG